MLDAATPHAPSSHDAIVGNSLPMQRLRTEIARYAPRTATVLIQGDTGTGKELVARALHDQSPRVRCPFVAVNVACLRKDLATSELFGHCRGAFTGALAPHRGYFEQAHGGTLFLDEIGELEPTAQADLLRVLESGEIRPVGCERIRTVDVKVIAATHRDLADMVAAGTFRADLFYRLNVLTITVPPLRDRLDDLPVLVSSLLARLHPEIGHRVLTASGLAALSRHSWPGNVRELFNVLRRATARTDASTLGVTDILDGLAVIPSVPRVPVVRNPRRDIAPETIADALREAGSVSAAARRLGIARSTVRDRVKAFRQATQAS